jgi:ABC-2 type transport system ATP-binding protein
MIEVHNLVKRYGPTVAVDDVSFDVPKGEVVGFLGPNGAGKTTTMRIVTCYLPADAGRVTVDGYDSFEQSMEVRRRIGYLPESAPLYLDMGVIDYLRFVAGMRGIVSGERDARVRRMIDVCALGPMLQKDIGELSKGYRQRVGLAATLIHDPEVLVLDEPTSGLDPNQIIEIRELIRQIGREKTIILSTHILPEVEATCSRVIVINEGRIVADGTTEELTRMSTGRATTVLTVRAAATAAEPRLRGVEGIESVRLLEGGSPSSSRWEVVSPSNADIEAKLFRLAVESGWILTEIHTATLSLEQVFLRLTTGEKAPAGRASGAAGAGEKRS